MHAWLHSHTNTACMHGDGPTITCTALNMCAGRWAHWSWNVYECAGFMYSHCSVCETGKLANLSAFCKICRLYNNTEKAQHFSLHNRCGKQCLLDWQSLLEGSYFSNQQSNYKGILLGSPHVIWSQWLDHPLIGEWLLNSLGYAGYKLANACPAVFINGNIPNVPKHVLAVIYVYTGIHFSTNKLQEAGKNWKDLKENGKPRGNIFTNGDTQEGHVRVNTNYCSSICQL